MLGQRPNREGYTLIRISFVNATCLVSIYSEENLKLYKTACIKFHLTERSLKRYRKQQERSR